MNSLIPKPFLQFLKIIYAIIKTVFICLFLFITFLLVLPLLPFAKDYQGLVVMSGSMEPKIKVGSVIFIIPVEVEKLKTSDIITFAPLGDEKNLITHRIIKKIENANEIKFQTKGDANDKPDNWEVRPDQIKGKVLISLAYFGYLINFAKTPKGLVVLIIAPGILIIIDELRNIKREIERKYKEEYQKKLQEKEEPID